jgi:hypothetical protein
VILAITFAAILGVIGWLAVRSMGQTSDEPPAKPVDRVIGVVGVGVLVAIVGGLIQ